jgi:predicted RNase H-like HicB family nuclease
MRDTVLALRTGAERTQSVILLTVDFQEYEGQWVGTILELGVSTYADTLDELRSELTDALLLQLNEIERLGFTDEYLKEQGVKQLVLPDKLDDKTDHNWELAQAGV